MKSHFPSADNYSNRNEHFSWPTLQFAEGRHIVDKFLLWFIECIYLQITKPASLCAAKSNCTRLKTPVKKFQILFFLLLILSSLFLNAQQKTDSTQSVRKKWEIGIPLSLTLIPQPKKINWYKGYGLSILIKYTSSKHIGFSSGFNYDVLAPGLSRWVDYAYLNIPLLLEVSLGQRNFFIDAGTGLSGGIINIMIRYPNYKTNVLLDKPYLILTLITKIGISYQMKNGVRIFLAPQIYNGITPITSPTAPLFIATGYSHLIYFKIATGISYTF